jgi:hypothetical protein
MVRRNEMGYRSDVHAVFYTTDKEKWPVLKLYIDENFPKELMELEEIDDPRVGGYYFQELDTKWYDSFPDVQNFVSFVDEFRSQINEKEHAKDWCYEFVRIGEDINDVQEVYDGAGVMWSLLRVRRTVDTAFNVKEK